MASLEKSRNSLQQGVGVEPLFVLRCDRDIGHADLITTVTPFLPWACEPKSSLLYSDGQIDAIFHAR